MNLDDRAKFLTDLERNGSLSEVECQLRSWRGTVHTMLLSADIIEINREPHMLVFGLDITQRKQAEAELLRTLAREKELGQLRSKFVSMVSHEFRTPLASSSHPLKSWTTTSTSWNRPNAKSICNPSAKTRAEWPG